MDADIPRNLRTGVTDLAHATLAYKLVNQGLLQPEDLRVGGGGLRRMVEKVFERWWREAGLPGRLTSSLQFEIVTDARQHAVPGAVTGEPWLILDRWAMARRYYLRHLFGKEFERHPVVASHALAITYRALDLFSYSLTPPLFLQFAQRYWWKGADDIDAATRKKTGFLTRKMFETRFDPSTLAPRTCRWPNGGHPWAEVRAVESAMRARPLLTRNAHDLTDHPVVDFPLILRWRYDDDHGRLADHWLEEIRPRRRAGFTGAWRLVDVAEIERVRLALPNTVRLIHATDDLLDRLATSSIGGFYS
jgi:hypothetical protein